MGEFGFFTASIHDYTYVIVCCFFNALFEFLKLQKGWSGELGFFSFICFHLHLLFLHNSAVSLFMLISFPIPTEHFTIFEPQNQEICEFNAQERLGMNLCAPNM